MLHTCGRYLKIIGLDFTIGPNHFWNHIAENLNTQRVHEKLSKVQSLQEREI